MYLLRMKYKPEDQLFNPKTLSLLDHLDLLLWLIGFWIMINLVYINTKQLMTNKRNMTKQK